MATDNYVAVIGEFEYFFEATTPRFIAPLTSAVQASGLKQPRNGHKTVRVNVFRLTIIQGKIRRDRVGSYEEPLPFEIMTREEYDKEIVEVVEGLPEKFQDFIRQEAWERSSSDGYEQILATAQDLVHKLKKGALMFSEKEAWLYLSELWGGTNDSITVSSRRIYKSKGLCSSIISLANSGLTSHVIAYLMLDKVPYKEGYLWSLTPDGAKERAKFCRRQHELL